MLKINVTVTVEDADGRLWVSTVEPTHWIALNLEDENLKPATCREVVDIKVNHDNGSWAWPT